MQLQDEMSNFENRYFRMPVEQARIHVGQPCTYLLLLLLLLLSIFIGYYCSCFGCRSPLFFKVRSALRGVPSGVVI